jgi:mercuric ion binding protein
MITILALVLGLFTSGAAMAAEQTVTLSVGNMTCPSCETIVQRTLSAIPGVSKVVVSAEKKSAVVTFDDTRTSIQGLTEAVTAAGYPTRLATAPGAGGDARTASDQTRSGGMMMMRQGMKGGMMKCPMMGQNG